jgi:DNA polymerase-1
VAVRILVDADYLVYECGFATQSKDEKGNVVAEPVAFALAGAKNALEAIYSEVAAWLAQSGEAPQPLEVFLSGKDNFRDRVATIVGYKANRAGKPKPIHYNAIREYLINHWSAKVIDGHEADDELAIQAAKEGYDPDRVMIASIDKDLKTVPGLLYSFKKKQAFHISEQEALGNFYRQMITGDTADNIKGVWKSGAKAANEIKDDWEERDMWEHVLRLFEGSVKKPGCPYTDPHAAAIETGRLLHLLRYPGQLWEPPK